MGTTGRAALEEKALGEILLTGQISSFSDYETIKHFLNDQLNKGAEQLEIEIRDSKSVTSSVIGYLIKLLNLNKAKISILVHQEQLFGIFDDLNLIEPFDVRRI